MLNIDSLVLDIIFNAGAEPTPEQLIEAMGGEEVAGSRVLLDPDMEDPRLEMQLSPSAPFRRRGERRLLIIDDSVAPMRKDPQQDPIVPIDLRPEKARLLKLAQTLDLRLARMFALGGWGDAVVIAKSARDLRGIALLSWVLDPTVDLAGRRRANRLNQQEFEEKILAYDKRLDELDEQQILASIGPATFTRQGELLVLDVLESDGTWDVRKSYAMEAALAAIDKFSALPGAPSAGAKPAPAPAKAAAEPARPEPPPEPPRPAGPPVRAVQLGDRVVLVFPPERWDLDMAAALGKKDFDAVVRASDAIPGQLRDQMQRDGAGFLAPLEFLSEVFVDGKPLARPQFDADAAELGAGVRGLEVHCPRFGPALLLVTADRGRFITSERGAGASVLELLG